MNAIGDAEHYALSKIEMGRLAWMALALTPEMGPTRIARAMARLVSDGEDSGRLFEVSLTELEGLGIPARAAQFVSDGRARVAAEDEAKRVAEAGGFFITREDEAYPERLLEIYDPPAVLWIRGDVALLGTRRDCRGGYAAAVAVRGGDGGDVVARSCESAIDDSERDGSWCGYGRA